MKKKSNDLSQKRLCKNSINEARIKYIDTDFIKEICINRGRMIMFRKNEYFVKEGEAFPYIGFVDTGILKYTCTNMTEKKDYNTGFAFPNEFVADYPACLYNTLSTTNIQAITLCKVYICHSIELWLQYEHDIEGQKKARINAEQLFSQTYSRYLDIYRLTPEERYKELLERCPDILQLISLKELASYLKITPVHMSRIRRKITFLE